MYSFSIITFQWKRQLKNEQEEASETKFVNKMLLRNILPHHVADVYLTRKRETGRLYSEYYSAVSVMFASIPDYLDFFTEAELSQQRGGVRCLKLLNEIIRTFDMVMLRCL